MNRSATVADIEETDDAKDDGGITPPPPPTRRSRAYVWMLAIVTLALLLAVLGYAETVWLHEDLPQDRANRVALVVFPGEGAPGQSGSVADLGPNWPSVVATRASDPNLLRAIVARGQLSDASTGQPWPPERVRSMMTLDSQCIDVQVGPGQSSRGLLLVNVVRGSDASVTAMVARAWSEVFIRQTTQSFPGLEVEPVETFRGTYEICY